MLAPDNHMLGAFFQVEQKFPFITPRFFHIVSKEEEVRYESENACHVVANVFIIPIAKLCKGIDSNGEFHWCATPNAICVRIT